MTNDDVKLQLPITLDRVLWASRRKLRLSQSEFAKELSDKVYQIDHILYSKIENARIDIRLSNWNWLIPRLARRLRIDPLWLESIRQQTNVKSISPDTPALITYVRQPGS